MRFYPAIRLDDCTCPGAVPRSIHQYMRRLPFHGSAMIWMNQGAFLMRGLDKCRAEFSLTALAGCFFDEFRAVRIDQLDHTDNNS